MLHLWTNIFRLLSGELNRGLKASFTLHKAFAGGSFYGVNSMDSFGMDSFGMDSFSRDSSNSSSTFLPSLNFQKTKKAICVNQNTLVAMCSQVSFIGCLANRFFVGLDQRKLAQGNADPCKPTETNADKCRQLRDVR